VSYLHKRKLTPCPSHHATGFRSSTPHAAGAVGDIHLTGGITGCSLVIEFNGAVKICSEEAQDVGPLPRSEVVP
jgi:hypothetical protein